MRPIHYKIYLEPDLENFTFNGKVHIHIQSDDAVKDIVLNANELTIQSCKLQQGDVSLYYSFSMNASRQEVVISLPESVPGRFIVTLDYYGAINDQYAGLYRSRYEVDGRIRYMASTQFQANDARRAFPCFDHPGQKATFDIELLVDEGLTAVSNTAILKQTPIGNGKKRVQFERTPPMSTYLIFMGIGEFDAIHADTDSFRVRVLTAPGKGKYGRYALNIGQKSLQFCEEYTGILYSLSKCDLIAMPDSIGAMENYGAIRHSEDIMLVYPDQTPFSTKVLIGQIIAHEVSHMWFGNLVTPADWKYLWLNESFATYFTFVIPHALYPEWHIWHDFAADRMRSGLDRDGLLETVPIELPPGQALTGNPAPTPSNAPIVYNKGAAVLRMLAAYVGDAAFRRGLNHYLYTCQFKSITSQQFWNAFSAVVQQDVSQFAEAWIYQLGFPLVTAVRTQSTLHLRQQRFTFSPNDSDALWPIPIELLIIGEDGVHKKETIIFHEAETAVSLPPHTRACKLNHNQTSFYRAQYDAANLAALGELISVGQLNELDSFNVQNDLFALMRRGDVAAADYLAFVAGHFAAETHYLPLLDIAQNLRQLYLLLPAQRPQIINVGRVLCKQGLQATSMMPQSNENHQQVRLRQELLWAAGLFGSEDVRQFGRRQFAEWDDGTAVVTNILPAILKLGAMTHPNALPILLEKLHTPDLPEAEAVLILEALGQLPQVNQLQQALAHNWQEVAKSQRIHMIAATVFNPAATDFMWNWLLEHQEQLGQLHPGQAARTLVGLLPVVGLGRETAVHNFCQTFATTHPPLQDTLTMALKWLAINGRMRGKL
ncbi:MAG: M1 family metallopeptidase [Chloroflexi bacterium]|nr:M1 family metallopeptidase [Chloroflexota bacterium]